MWVFIGGESEGLGFLLHFIMPFYIYECIFHQYFITWLILSFPLFACSPHLFLSIHLCSAHFSDPGILFFFIPPKSLHFSPLALSVLLFEFFSVSTLFLYIFCSFAFSSSLLTATQKHLSIHIMVPIGLRILLAVLIKMFLRTRRFDLAWCFSATIVAQILDLSWANHVNICCFLPDCYSSSFDSILFDPIQVYVE